MNDLSQAAFDVITERERQRTAEGWTEEHDDAHEEGAIAAAASAYALNAACNLHPQANQLDAPPDSWPWSPEWWKPKDPRRDLVRAGALILAEIERLDRLAAEPAKVEPRFDLVAHLERQRAFSLKTFGPGARTKGVTDHIARELDEIRADPSDISEWVDVIILGFDGAWRAGWEPKDIVVAILAKQAKNEGRVWPDWRTADPDRAIEHDRSHDATDPAKGGEE